MKAAILAGGKGTRFAEQTRIRPKPMISIGGHPILWHILKHYQVHGISDFAIALGYKGEVIRRWFLEQEILHARDGVANGTTGLISSSGTDLSWNVDLVETGLETQTGGRIKALQSVLGDETFLLSWGDGVSNVDLTALREFHAAHGRLATMVVVRPPAKFGHVDLEGDQITAFQEKPEKAEGWINGGIFVLEPEVFRYIEGPSTQFERGPLNELAAQGQLMAFRHEGYWQCMDTIHEHRALEETWATGRAPWVTWKDAQCAHS